MRDLSLALRAYQSFDPSAWVGVYRLIPVWLGIVMAGLGLVLLLFGGGRAFRVVAGPLGALVGLLWAPVLAARLQVVAPPSLPLASALVLAAVGFAFPPAVVFVAMGLPAGLLAGQLAGPEDWFLGFVPGFLLCGTVAALLQRYVGAVASSLAGAWILVLGMLSLLYPLGGAAEAVAAKPWGVIIAAALFALAGSIFQLAGRPPAEEIGRRELDERRERQRAREKAELEQRWSNYTANRQNR